jgi:galactokinase
MRPVEARRKGMLLDAATEALAAKAPQHRSDLCAFWVPGRIEFLGKHTDYAGGRSLLCAVERGLAAVAAPRTDSLLRIIDPQTRAVAETEIAEGVVPTVGHWSSYAVTVARRLARNFAGPLRGADIALASDLPQAAGMSSSSAVVVAVYSALVEINRLAERREYRQWIRTAEDVADYLGAVERGCDFGGLPGDTGVGTLGGSEDHTAILCARQGMLLQYGFQPVRLERAMALPLDHVFVVAVSGVVAEKTGAARQAYNRAAQASADIVDHWSKTSGRPAATLAEVLSSSPVAVERLRAALPVALRNRLDHFVIESYDIIPAAADAIESGNLARLGELVDRSQEAAERLLGNQVPETIALARSARDLGAVAASAFGAGFGGSVWALVAAEGAEEFRGCWADAYHAEFSERERHSEFLITGAGPAAMTLSDVPLLSP